MPQIEVTDQNGARVAWLGGDIVNAPGTLGPGGQDWDVFCLEPPPPPRRHHRLHHPTTAATTATAHRHRPPPPTATAASTSGRLHARLLEAAASLGLYAGTGIGPNTSFKSIFTLYRCRPRMSPGSSRSMAAAGRVWRARW